MKDLNQVEWRRLFKNQALKDVQELVRGLWVFPEAAEANICKQTLKGWNRHGGMLEVENSLAWPAHLRND